FIILTPPPISTLFPYTTLFRSISLHAANDLKRREIMPIAKKYSIKELINACKYYLEKTNRRITFEYALIQGINDPLADAVELGRSEEHTSELQSRFDLVCRLLL